MKKSVVMATFNGERYIKEQLNSIKNQSLAPDEVLIFDDGSTDNTLEIVKNFIKDNKLQGWELRINEKNKGWEKNFIDGIKASSGDIVFLSDQDDIWHPDKIRIMTEYLLDNSSCNLLMCAFKKFYDEKIPDLDDLPQKLFSKRSHSPKGSIISHPGCSYCFRKAFFNFFSESWTDGVPHDLLIHIAGWANDSAYVCSDVLHYFRRHSESATAKANPMLKKKKRLDYLHSVWNSIIGLEKCNEFGINNKNFRAYKIFISLRIELIEKRRFFNAIKLLKYLSFFKSLRTFFADVFVAIRGSSKKEGNLK